MKNSRTVRIFLSSTFRDFEEERRLLVQQVFPALRTRLRERFVELVDIDLRWGISAEEAEQGQVLSICLDEIDQCRPYFIGLLGERYGWVPPQNDYPTHLADSHTWLTEHRGAASVTELEIRYGVLDNPEMHQRALFFFRDRAYAEQLGKDYLSANEIDRQRQESLKAQIKNSQLPVFGYEKPKDLAVLLEEKLWAQLDAEFPAEIVPDRHELENLNHSSFTSTKLGPRFVEDPSLRLSLHELIDGEDQRLLVTGPAGIGKSTLIADWVRSNADPKSIVLYHSLEAGEGADRVVDILRRLFESIRRHTASKDAVPQDRTSLLNGMPEWLATAHSYATRKEVRWIIVLDGLDRLRNERNLLWLPTFIPSSVKMLVSCRPSVLQSTLKRRGKWGVMKLQGIQPKRRIELFSGQLTAFKKQLSESQLEAVLDHRLADQPLFLCTLAEELRVFGSFEGLQDQLNELLSSNEIDDLYEKILFRLEVNHELIGVKRALSAICLSQGGLTEEEVLEFSGLAFQARWSPLRLALGEALFYTSGRIRPAHGFFSKAVRDRYYPDHETERVLRLELANWFGQRSKDRRSAWEQPAQLALAGAHQELLNLLSDREVFELVHRMGGNERMHRYWSDIETTLGVTPGSHYQTLWTKWREEMNLEQRLEASARLHKFLRYYGSNKELTQQLSLERLEDCIQLYGKSDIRYLRQVSACAETLAQSSNLLDQARSMAEQACIETERIAGSNSKDLPNQLLTLAGILLKQRNTTQGIAVASRSLKLMENQLGLEHPSLIPYLNCLTDLFLVNAGKALKGDGGQTKGNMQLREAITLQLRCLKILGLSEGKNNLASAACFVRTGQVFKRCHILDNSIRAYEQAVNIRSRLLGLAHPLTQSARKLLKHAKETSA